MAAAVADRPREQPLRPKHLADGDLAGEIGDHANAFGIPVRRADTWSPAALMETAAESVAAVQQGAGPVFLQIGTCRLMAQSKGDDGRDPEERRAYWEQDELESFRRRRPQDSVGLLAKIEAELDAAFAHQGDVMLETVPAFLRKRGIRCTP